MKKIVIQESEGIDMNSNYQLIVVIINKGLGTKLVKLAKKMALVVVQSFMVMDL